MPHTDNKDINKQVQYADQCLKKGDTAAAQKIFDQITVLPEEDVAALIRLGSLASRLGENVAAINIYSDLVEKYPDNAGYLDSLARSYIDNGMLLQAAALLEKAIEINPDTHSSYVNLAFVSISQGQYSAAIEPLEKALKLKPSDPAIYTNLVTALNHSGDPEQAYKYAQKLIRLQPDKAESYHLLGVILSRLGKFDKAIINFEKAIRLNKTLGYSYFDLASVKKFSDADSQFINKAEKVLQSSMSASHRASIHFALGKIYNDCNEWDKAFEHYKQANLIGKPALQDQVAADIFNKTHKKYTKKLFELMEKIGSQSEVPVFVVGMPRSGTTLIEQIIASHPYGEGAGELSEIERIHNTICPIEKLSSYKQELDKVLNSEALGRHAESYLKVLCDKRDNAARIVDKMPDNFLMLGLINMLFPKAHIIHAVRSPIDTCLSCYFVPFREVSWASDLGWISERYALYKRAMEYWKSVFPEGKIIDVRYEELVNDPEGQSKRLIESIGLEWDPVCLEYYKESRTVKTASLWQARQPIYTSSSKRWINYANHILTLINGLQDSLDDDEINELERQGVKLKKKWFSNILNK